MVFSQDFLWSRFFFKIKISDLPTIIYDTFDSQGDGSRLDIGVDPSQDESGVIIMNSAMADRFVRQSDYGHENGVDHRVQLKGIRVDCGATSSNGVIAVEIEFLEPFYGVIYSKGRHDDPKCM